MVGRAQDHLEGKRPGWGGGNRQVRVRHGVTQRPVTRARTASMKG